MPRKSDSMRNIGKDNSMAEKLTQEQTVLKHLRRYGRITNIDAINKYAIFRLSEMIRRLRIQGYPIYTEWVQNKKTKVRYGVYRMERGTK